MNPLSKAALVSSGRQSQPSASWCCSLTREREEMVPEHLPSEHGCIVDTRWSSKSGLMRQIFQPLNASPEAAAEYADKPARRWADVKADAVGFPFYSVTSFFSSLKLWWKPDPDRLCNTGHLRDGLTLSHLESATFFFSFLFSQERHFNQSVRSEWDWTHWCWTYCVHPAGKCTGRTSLIEIRDKCRQSSERAASCSARTLSLTQRSINRDPKLF